MSKDIETDCVRVNPSTPVTFTPKYSNFISCSDRVKSFKNWPKQMRQQPNELAKNGFFYGGVTDQVICFCCGVGMQSWNVNDVIEHEHRKWTPRCEYLRMTLS